MRHFPSVALHLCSMHHTCMCKCSWYYYILQDLHCDCFKNLEIRTSIVYTCIILFMFANVHYKFLQQGHFISWPVIEKDQLSPKMCMAVNTEDLECQKMPSQSTSSLVHMHAAHVRACTLCVSLLIAHTVRPPTSDTPITDTVSTGPTSYCC